MTCNGAEDRTFRAAALLLILINVSCGFFLPASQRISLLYVTAAPELDVSFDPSFPSEWTGYVRDFFNVIYPEMKIFCGPPTKSGTILFKFDTTRQGGSAYYDRRSNMIVCGRPNPTKGQIRDIWWDLSIVEQISYVFYGPIDFLARWAQGVHRAVANLVMMSISQKEKLPVGYANWIHAVKSYDAFNYLGGDVVGGMTWGEKASGTPFWSQREGMFLLLAYSFPSKQAGQLDYLARILKGIQQNANSKRLDLTRESSFRLDRPTFDMILDDAADGERIDDLFPSIWVQRQAVTLEKGAAGPNLGVFIDDVDSPGQISVLAFEREFDPKNPTQGWERPIKNLPVQVRLINWKGDLIYQGNVTTVDNGRAWARSNWWLAEGAYMAFAEANYKESRLSGKAYAISLGPGVSIQQPSRKLLGVILNEEGRPIPGSIKINGGRLEFCRNGIFSIEPEGSSDRFDTQLTSSKAERRFTKPSTVARIVPMPSVYARCRVKFQAFPSEVSRYVKISETECDPDSFVKLTMDKVVAGPSGTRYMFTYWTVDGRRYDAETTTIRVDKQEMIATAVFRVQYELIIRSDFGTPQGSGWYDEGSVATFSVTSPANLGIHAFERWTGNSTSTLPTSTVVMSSPKTVIAVWRIDQFALITVILGVVGASAVVGFVVRSRRKGKVAAPAAPTAAVEEAKPEAPAEVKETKEIPSPKIIPMEEAVPPLHERVYDYILKHEGTISLSQAAKDLGITIDELKAAIEKLREEGRLG